VLISICISGLYTPEGGENVGGKIISANAGNFSLGILRGSHRRMGWTVLAGVFVVLRGQTVTVRFMFGQSEGTQGGA